MEFGTKDKFFLALSASIQFFFKFRKELSKCTLCRGDSMDVDYKLHVEIRGDAHKFIPKIEWERDQ